MILLLKKNLRLVLYTRIILWLPVYTIFQISFQIEPISLGPMGNVWIAFVITATLNSSISSLEGGHGIYQTIASLPLRRRDFIHGDILSNGFFTLLALAYTSLSALLIDIFMSGQRSANGPAVSAGEWIALLVMISIITFYNSFIYRRSPALAKNVLFNLSEKLIILFVCFVALPYIIVSMDKRTWKMDILLEGGPIKLFNDMISIFNRPGAMGMAIIMIIALSYAAIYLSIFFFQRKDLQI